MNVALPRKLTAALMLSTVLTGCASIGKGPVALREGSPVTTNHTPYSQCLSALGHQPGDRLPVLSVGQIVDRTGQASYSTITESRVLTQGVSEMLISALYKTRKVRLAERLDIRIPLAERQLHEAGAMQVAPAPLQVQPVNFVVLGALTELNYNILSQGTRLFVRLAGGGVREAVINVGLDLRVIDATSFQTIYVTSLQKQIVGQQVEAGVYRFFGNQLVEFDAGRVRNEPLQLGVRSVVEMAAYQILTEGLGLPNDDTEECRVADGHYPAAQE